VLNRLTAIGSDVGLLVDCGKPRAEFKGRDR
jgi:hypothetical protein